MPQSLERDGNAAPLAPYRTIFTDYLALAEHSYATVRADAQDALDRAGSNKL